MASSDADVVATGPPPGSGGTGSPGSVSLPVPDRGWRSQAVRTRSACSTPLCRRYPMLRRRVFVAHVDHLLRPGSAADAEHVKRVALSLGVAGTIHTVNVPALAKAEHIGIEEAARIGRYRSLRRYAQSIDAHCLLTGHTRDDLVETVVLHLLRGSGTARSGRHQRGSSGLAGWSFLYDRVDTVTDLRLLRPLLQVGRAETVAYCEAREIRHLIDESNADPTFARNRVRGHLLPVLRTYSPSIDQALARHGERPT